VQDGQQGFLVPPRDADAAARALDRLLEDESLRRRMGAAGRQLMHEMNWDRNAAQMHAVFADAAFQRRVNVGPAVPAFSST
jgi:glycosyltransferase involved in cell wall biosynthesis